jgi:hypothetical protein
MVSAPFSVAATLDVFLLVFCQGHLWIRIIGPEKLGGAREVIEDSEVTA